jgi:hypothetical protein
MKRKIAILVLAFCAAAWSYNIPKWKTVTDTTNIRKTVQDQYIYQGRHYLGTGLHLIELAAAEAVDADVSDLQDTTAAHNVKISALRDSSDSKDSQGWTYVVAASNSRNRVHADYICDGTNDETEINTALALCTSGGYSDFTVKLLPGTYNIKKPIYVQAQGSLTGEGALIHVVEDTMTTALYVAWGVGSGERRHHVDGISLLLYNRTLSEAIKVRTAPAGSFFENVHVWWAANSKGFSIFDDSIYLINCTVETGKNCVETFSSYLSIVGGNYTGTDSSSVALSSSYCTITGAHLVSTPGPGYAVDIRGAGSYNSVTGCHIRAEYALKIGASSYNNFTGNNLTASTFTTIVLGAASSYCNVSGNSIDCTGSPVYTDAGTGNTVVLANSAKVLADSLTAHNVKLSAIRLLNANQDTSLSNIRNKVYVAPVIDAYGALLGAQGYRGETITLTAGENMIIGHLCYIKSDGKAWRADADSAATMPAMYVATATTSANNAGTFLVKGRLCRTDLSWNWTVGSILYPSTDKGLFTQTAPTGSGDQVEAVGQATATDEIMFTPYPILVEK